jgi:hypothetical protein
VNVSHHRVHLLVQGQILISLKYSLRAFRSLRKRLVRTSDWPHSRVPVAKKMRTKERKLSGNPRLDES